MGENLLKLQEDFQQYLLGKSNDIAQAILGTEALAAAKRLAIYQDAYLLRLLESLSLDYPILAKLMGEDAFAELGGHYIFENPSIYRSIRWYGQTFPDFIRQQGDDDCYQLWYEMGLFEYSLNAAFDATDSPVVQESDMQTIPPEQWAMMQFNMHPSLRQFDLSWNVTTTWKILKSNDSHAPLVEKYEQPCSWIVWRKALETLFHPLKPDEAWALQAMMSGESFGSICEDLSQWVNQDQLILHAATLLKSWIHMGLIATIELS